MLSLPALTSIAVTSGATTYVQALSGGDLNLPLVAQAHGSADVESEGAGSTIDLSSLADFNGGSLTVTGQGSVLNANLTTLSGVDVTLDGTGTPATQQWTALTNGSVTITGGSYTLAIDDFDGSSAYVNTGSSLTMTDLATYSIPNMEDYTYFKATGASAVLNFPALVRLGNFNTDSVLHVQATQGGQVLVHALTSINSTGQADESVQVDADGTDSEVDLCRSPSSTSPPAHSRSRTAARSSTATSPASTGST